MMARLNLHRSDKRTLRQLYDEMSVDPEFSAIVMVLEGGKKIPIARRYDDVPLDEVVNEISNSLRERKVCFIGNILGHSYIKESLHHFETLPRDSADSLEARYFSGNIVT